MVTSFTRTAVSQPLAETKSQKQKRGEAEWGLPYLCNTLEETQPGVQAPCSILTAITHTLTPTPASASQMPEPPSAPTRALSSFLKIIPPVSLETSLTRKKGREGGREGGGGGQVGSHLLSTYCVLGLTLVTLLPPGDPLTPFQMRN